eukprot:885195-Pyramimonas_sp.AAC.1
MSKGIAVGDVYCLAGSVQSQCPSSILRTRICPMERTNAVSVQVLAPLHAESWRYKAFRLGVCPNEASYASCRTK